jgi:hypothetical protein
MNEDAKVEGIVPIPGPSRRQLNERQIIAYGNHREDLIRWLATMGKDPEKLEGYAHDTARNYAAILDKFYREYWEQNDGYTTDLTHDDADEYLRELVLSDEYLDSHLHNVQLALKAYFRWRSGCDEWESAITVSNSSGANQPKDYVTMDERKALREAALEYGTVPAYHHLDPDERAEWKRFLASRFGKPASEVSVDDWKRANGFKYPSLIHTALDAGLRPIGVGRAKTYWVDFENALLHIPADESSKNEDNWTVSLREETSDYLARWL